MPQREMAIVFLVLLGMLPVVSFWLWSRTTPFRGFKAFLNLIAVWFARVLWRAEVPPLPLAPGRGAVIVSNHRSSIDPFFIQLGVDRLVHWMVAREYCEHPALGWFLRLAEVIPVSRRGIDTAATKAAIRWVAGGGLIGMFPEGRINVTDQFMLPGRPGAVLVALKARVPIVPCYIDGSPYRGTTWSPFFTPAKVRVCFGEPIDLSPYYGCQHEPGLVGRLMLEVLAAIARLADQPDFEPRLAGRRWRPTTG